jgi:aminopeptidase N
VREAATYQRPLVCKTYDSSWDLFDRHLYPGGALRLHMLRDTLGDATFWAGVRQYVSKQCVLRVLA